MPFLLTVDEVVEMLAWARELRAWSARSEPLEVLVWPAPAVDPGTDRDRIVEQAEHVLGARATMVNYRFKSRSPGHHIDQMAALTEILAIDPPLSTS
jgi:hypothetical protein